jgi:hypothetical protein
METVIEGNDIWFVARVRRPDNVILSRDDISGSGGSNSDALQIRIYDISKDSLGTGTNGRQVFQSNQADNNDGFWNGLDSEGYNFIYRVRASGAAYTAGRRFQAEFAFETTAYGTIRWTEMFYVKSALSV